MTSRMKRLMHIVREVVLLLVSVAVVTGGIAASFHFMKNRPQPRRQKPPQMAPLVEVQEVHAQSHQVTVSVMGTVLPAVEVVVRPRVSGEIVAIHPDFLEGGIVKAGDVLVRIEPRDYELAIVSQEAQLETARNECAIEQGQQDVAQREWELLGMQDKASDLDRELALRQPQLRQKQAKLRTAEAALEKAQLDLSRTVIKAPCNGIIRSADVDVGDQATLQTTLATIVGSDTYWVQVSIPADELKWVVLPQNSGAAPSTARVYTSSGAVRAGGVISLLSDVEPNGRMARLLVEVPDPLGREAEGDLKPLLLGEYVRVAILGLTVEDVFSIPRDALRDGNMLWLATEDSTLDVLEADIVWSDTQKALLRGLSEGDRIIVSDVATPVEGMALQVRGEAAASAGTEHPDKVPHDMKPAESR